MTQAKRITLADVAREAGVSMATASKAMNGRVHVSASARERVQDAARRLEFTPNPFAQALTFSVTGTIGVLTADLSNRFVLPILMGIEEAFGAGSTSVLLCDARGDRIRERFLLNTLIAKRVDGIVILGDDTNPRQSISGDVTVPVVYAYAPSDSPEDCSFTPDNAMGARLAVEHLVGRGRRRIALVNGEPRFDAARERAAGASAAMAELGLELVGGDDLYGEWSEAWGRHSVAALTDAGLGFDAVLCASDQIARGVVDELRDSGRRVPHDVAVVGFDNWQLFSVTSRPPITTIDMNLEQLGRAVAGELSAAISGQHRTGVHRLAVDLVPRESTARL